MFEDQALVAATGDLDLSSLLPLRRAMDRAWCPERGLVVDLSAASSVDWSVVELLERAARAVGDLTLRAPTPGVLAALDRSRVRDRFLIEP